MFESVQTALAGEEFGGKPLAVKPRDTSKTPFRVPTARPSAEHDKRARRRGLRP